MNTPAPKDPTEGPLRQSWVRRVVAFSDSTRRAISTQEDGHAAAALSSTTLLERARQTRRLSVTRREDIARLRAIAGGRFAHVH